MNLEECKSWLDKNNLFILDASFPPCVVIRKGEKNEALSPHFDDLDDLLKWLSDNKEWLEPHYKNIGTPEIPWLPRKRESIKEIRKMLEEYKTGQ